MQVFIHAVEIRHQLFIQIFLSSFELDMSIYLFIFPVDLSCPFLFGDEMQSENTTG